MKIVPDYMSLQTDSLLSRPRGNHDLLSRPAEKRPLKIYYESTRYYFNKTYNIHCTNQLSLKAKRLIIKFIDIAFEYNLLKY